MAEIPINDISTSARTVVTRGPKQDEVSLTLTLSALLLH
jgi:hypothetical protein